MKKDNDLPELVTLKDACDMLSCHPNTLRMWDEKGILKAVRIGQRKDRRYRKEDLIKFLESTNPKNDEA
jgi:excisionase family DNA binding protein